MTADIIATAACSMGMALGLQPCCYSRGACRPDRGAQIPPARMTRQRVRVWLAERKSPDIALPGGTMRPSDDPRQCCPSRRLVTVVTGHRDAGHVPRRTASVHLFGGQVESHRIDQGDHAPLERNDLLGLEPRKMT